jgi:hypothetical protein
VNRQQCPNLDSRLPILGSARTRDAYLFFFVFFEREGITATTVSAMDDAIRATTPFFGLRFVFEAAGRFAFDLDAGLDFVFAFDFVAVLAMADSAMPGAIH